MQMLYTPNRAKWYDACKKVLKVGIREMPPHPANLRDNQYAKVDISVGIHFCG